MIRILWREECAMSCEREFLNMPCRNFVLDGGGNPVPEPDLMKYLEWWEESREKDLRRVAKDVFGDVTVSTVFLGIDHGWHGVPVLFETMVFGGVMDGEQDRYHTRAEALEGHAAVVKRVRESLEGVSGG